MICVCFRSCRNLSFVNDVDSFVDNLQIINTLCVNNEESTDDKPGNKLNAELDAPAMTDAPTDEDYNQSIENFKENINCNVEVSDSIVTQYRPPSTFDFPKTLMEVRQCWCQHKWFEDFL